MKTDEPTKSNNTGLNTKTELTRGLGGETLGTGQC